MCVSMAIARIASLGCSGISSAPMSSVVPVLTSTENSLSAICRGNFVGFGDGLSKGLVVQRRRNGGGVIFRAGTSLLTASRVAEGSTFVRVMGPGKAEVNGIGRLLVFDEFFEFPATDGVRLWDADVLLESLIYYCDDTSISELESSSEVESFRPRHGLHLYLRSNLRSVKQGLNSSSPGNGISLLQENDPCVVENDGSLVLPMMTHLRESGTISPLGLDGGALVRVVAGSCKNISIPPPLQDFVMLDVQMRPGSETALPLDPSFGVLIYILEGVGIFEPNRFEEDVAPFYQNEGHGLYVPPLLKQVCTKEKVLRVRTHEWSHLRFILLGAPVS